MCAQAHERLFGSCLQCRVELVSPYPKIGLRGVSEATYFAMSLEAHPSGGRGILYLHTTLHKLYNCQKHTSDPEVVVHVLVHHPGKRLYIFLVAHS